MKRILHTIALLAAAGATLGSSAANAVDQAAYPLTINATAEQRDGFALLINANRQLCATALRITAVAEDRFEVKCKLYRDNPGLGTGEKTYLINMKTGKILR